MKTINSDILKEIKKPQSDHCFIRIKLFDKGDILDEDFYVKLPIYGILTMDSKGLYIDCEYLEVYSTGRTMHDLMEDVVGELCACYRIYVGNPEDTLSPNAKRLEKKLKRHIGRRDS